MLWGILCTHNRPGTSFQAAFFIEIFDEIIYFGI